MKSFKELCLEITENQYRELNAINYSLLSRYSQNGVRALKEDISLEGPGITFGSMVDTLITNKEAFNDLYYVSDVFVTPGIKQIVDYIVSTTSYQCDINSIPEEVLIYAIEACDWQPNWKIETKIKKVLSEGRDYYKARIAAINKIPVSNFDFKEAMELCKEITQGMWTKNIFGIKGKEGVEFLYQQKMKYTHEMWNLYGPSGKFIDLKAMIDIIIVDHNNKIIIPFDIKTTSSSLYNFKKSFYKYRYDIQAQLYNYILEKKCVNDDYFKDFSLLDIRFIVASREDMKVVSFIDDSEQGVYENNFKHWSDLLKEIVFLKTNGMEYEYDAYINEGLIKLNANDR